MKCVISDTPPISYFKYLNFWTEQEDFMEIVKNNWDEQVQGSAMYTIQQKLKRLAHFLSAWSRNTIGSL